MSEGINSVRTLKMQVDSPIVNDATSIIVQAPLLKALSNLLTAASDWKVAFDCIPLDGMITKNEQRLANAVEAFGRFNL